MLRYITCISLKKRETRRTLLANALTFKHQFMLGYNRQKATIDRIIIQDATSLFLPSLVVSSTKVLCWYKLLEDIPDFSPTDDVSWWLRLICFSENIFPKNLKRVSFFIPLRNSLNSMQSIPWQLHSKVYAVSTTWSIERFIIVIGEGENNPAQPFPIALQISHYLPHGYALLGGDGVQNYKYRANKKTETEEFCIRVVSMMPLVDSTAIWTV